MSATQGEKPPTATQVRGDIQRGLTGDKRPGIDPAAAPMETDAEAGGSAPTQDEIDMALASQARPGAAGPQGAPEKSRNFDSAMQPARGTLQKKPSLPALVPVIVGGLILAAILLGIALR